MAADILQLLRTTLGDGPDVWVAGDGWGWPLRGVVEPHIKFLDFGEAVLAVAAGGDAASPLVFTDRRLCWQAGDAIHRLAYADIRVAGLKVRGGNVVVPPTMRLRRRPDAGYAVHTPSPESAAALADLLRVLAEQDGPPAVSAPYLWIPRSAEDAAAPARAGRSATSPEAAAVGERLTGLAADGSPTARAELAETLGTAPLAGPAWAAAKRLYKAAESARDATVIGVLAYRFDVDDGLGRSRLTRLYMRRRAWRFLRTVGRQSPADYPRFAAETLRHYIDADLTEPERWSRCWTLLHLLHRDTPGLRFGSRGGYTTYGDPPALDADAAPAFAESWRASADPLLHLAESARSGAIGKWAVARLKADHPAAWQTPESAFRLLRSANREAVSAGRGLIWTHFEDWDVAGPLAAVAGQLGPSETEWAAHLTAARLAKRPDDLPAFGPFVRAALPRLAGEARTALIRLLREAIRRRDRTAGVAAAILASLPGGLSIADRDAALSAALRLEDENPSAAEVRACLPAFEVQDAVWRR